MTAAPRRPPPLRLLLVEDSPELLVALRDFLATQIGVEVVAVARSGERAMQVLDAARPDVVLSDLIMPEGMNGFELALRLRDLPRRPHVILMSVHGGPALGQAALRSGADAFCPKERLGEELGRLLEEARRALEVRTPGSPAPDEVR
jgi:DNA-binding NarL/FixJ family response regulator